MAAKDTQTTSRLVVEVSKDRLEAWVRPSDPDDPLPLTPEEIVAALEEAKIAVDDSVLERINAAVGSIAFEDEPPKQFLVAKGRPVIEGKDGEFLWHESLKGVEQDWQGDSPVNYYTLNSIVTVKEDQPIGTLVPAVPGAKGVDVFGAILKPTRHPKDVRLDASVKVSDDDATAVLANVAGKVVYQSGALSISKAFEVKGDVDFEIGNVDSSVDVYISGTIRDLFTVKSKKAVTTYGAVEAACIDAAGDVNVRGGIVQRGKGSIKSGGNIVVKFCEEADLHAAGSVKIVKGLINSRVHCEQKLLAAGGSIIGGQAYAREGVEIATIGSDANVPTEIIVGIHPDVIRRAEQLRESLKPKRETIERVRQSVQPLMADMKRLSADLRERATELIFQADEMEAEITEVESKRTEMLEAARATGTPYVLVSKVIHPGATIRIGLRSTVFHDLLHGPVKIEKRKIKNATEFVTVNQLSGSVEVLRSAPVVEQASDEDL